MPASWLQFLGGSAFGSIAGIVITSWLTSQRDHTARRVAFKRQQLQEFYGTLLAMHKEIRARSELRRKLAAYIDAHAMRGMDAATVAANQEKLQEEQYPVMVKNIQDEHETFRNVLMPRYRQMIDVFREKMWLADPTTRVFYYDLIEFVDVWDKIINEKAPLWVATEMGHSETKLHPFYEHLEKMNDDLRLQIS